MHTLTFNERQSKARRKRRRKVGLFILITLISITLFAWQYLSSTEGLHTAGIGSRLELVPLTDLPSWAEEVVHEHVATPAYQFVAAIIDLNRDQQPEILLAPAPPRQDLFVPEHPLTIFEYQQDRWSSQPASISCRPSALGSFTTNGFWDIRCSNAQGQYLLRRDPDGRYRPSAS